MKFFKIALFGCLATSLPLTAEASITMTSNFILANADDESGVGVTSTFSGESIPTFTTLDAVDSATSFSKNVINWSTSGGQTILSFDIEHRRPGTPLSIASTAASAVRFTANASLAYDLSGYYYVADIAANDNGVVSQRVRLYDVTASSILFENWQRSFEKQDEQFTLGEMGGDNDNVLAGSLTGTLIAGHSYELFFQKYMQKQNDPADLGASAVGNLTLTIGPMSAVPEAHAGLVWLGLAMTTGIATYCRRRV